ncbi:MAG: SDR family NAD(P)-dependent oxidoreductase [Bacteroidetes bacterium]|nr:SDR family NAD(P)-dependent oxidoreductase [Bacteroidota bacterium]MCL2301638.1 SDR family NAD(P)-dependent oxidoreductase [Lentimicrobiaceae bacterium]
MKIIIIGGTSGLGRGTAEILANQGHQVGITGRRNDLLEEIASQFSNIKTAKMDVIQENTITVLENLIQELDGMDMLLYSSGIGKALLDIDYENENRTNKTNIDGFTKIACFAYNYFKNQGNGHFAVISSVAGYRGLRGAPSYSATKGYQRLFIESLAQTAHHNKLNIKFTTIIPGFVDTDLIKDHKYPLTLPLKKAVRIIAKGLLKQKRYIFVDSKWRFIVFAMRIVPSWVWERML